MSLTRYPCGSLKELIALSFPFCLSLISNYLMSFCDRLILAHYSLEALEGCVSAAFLCQLFQLCLTYLTSITQVYVSQSIGKNAPKESGKCIWQMIWFSLATFFVTTPLCPVAEWFYFYGTPTETLGKIYFRCLMAFNFLFPLGTTLGAFFLGIGKGKIVFLASFTANLVNLALDPIFIFGISFWIPPMGIFGAALATGISQFLFCLILLFFLLRKNERKIYNTGNLKINLQLLWSLFKVGFPRTLTRFMQTTSWLVNAYMINVKGGDYLIALSVGSSFYLCFFIIEGMSNAILTVASYLIGKNDLRKILPLFRSSFFFLFLSSAALFFPFVAFPNKVLKLLFDGLFTYNQMILLERVCFWFWIWFMCNGISGISLALVTASKDTLFAFIVKSTMVWFFTSLPVYVFINHLNYPPQTLYLIMAFGGLISSLVCLIRFLYRYRMHILFPSRT